MPDLSTCLPILLLLPILGLVSFLFLSRDGQRYALFSTLIGFLIVLLSLYQFIAFDTLVFKLAWDWFSVGEYQLAFSLQWDFWSASMLLVVSIVAFLVQVFSLSYMAQEKRKSAYFLFLHVFVFAMLLLVLSSNLLLSFVAWELVGFASWLLIGFWYDRSNAVFASRKAFLINRIGDAGFVLALGVLFAVFGTLDYTELATLLQKGSAFSANMLLFQVGDSYPSFKLFSISWMHWAGGGLLLAVMAKSAQYPLAVWLPDAMEGPTPVSALIHAATMVAAGVYLLLRFHFIFTPPLLDSMVVIGSITAFMGAFAAFAQYDIKKILAYSTVSQLGFMVMAMGMGAWAAGFFHLLTHAFFKAGLFLLAGLIIHIAHAHSHVKRDQDIRDLGGILKAYPSAHVIFLLCAAALAGIPFSAGFLSKEAILDALLQFQTQAGTVPYAATWLALLSIPLTLLYMMRMWQYLYHGEKLLWSPKELRISPAMAIPLVVLALLSLGIWLHLGLDYSQVWLYEQVALLKPIPALPTVYRAVLLEAQGQAATYLSVGFLLIAASIAYWRFARPPRREEHASGALADISAHNWYLDGLHEALVVQPFLSLASLSAWIDTRIIDPVVILSARSTVVVASISAWADRKLVDGSIRLLARISAVLGRIVSTGKYSGMQDVVLLALGIFLVIMIWLFIN